MGVEGISEASGDNQEAEQEQRKDPEAEHYRKESERDQARRERSERLGHAEKAGMTESEVQARASENAEKRMNEMADKEKKEAEAATQTLEGDQQQGEPQNPPT